MAADLQHDLENRPVQARKISWIGCSSPNDSWEGGSKSRNVKVGRRQRPIVLAAVCVLWK